MVVNVVVTCTNRKTVPTPPRLRLRDIPPVEVAVRLDGWLRRLQESESPRRQALDMYCGGSWTTVREVVHEPKQEVRCFIASCGYGLIRSSDHIGSYGATFSPYEPDSVAASAGEASTLQAWWRGLSHWQGPTPGAPRSLAELARRDPTTPVLVAASPPYLRAMAGDLAEARQALKSPELLSILSAGIRSLDGVEPNIVPCDARLKNLFGGSLISLNVRFLLQALRELEGGPLTVGSLATWSSRLMQEAPPYEVIARQQQTDQGVCDFIASRLASDSHASCARLLRVFRDSGRACEQKRFGRLYRHVKGTLDGR